MKYSSVECNSESNCRNPRPSAGESSKLNRSERAGARSLENVLKATNCNDWKCLITYNGRSFLLLCERNWLWMSLPSRGVRASAADVRAHDTKYIHSEGPFMHVLDFNYLMSVECLRLKYHYYLSRAPVATDTLRMVRESFVRPVEHLSHRLVQFVRSGPSGPTFFVPTTEVRREPGARRVRLAGGSLLSGAALVRAIASALRITTMYMRHYAVNLHANYDLLKRQIRRVRKTCGRLIARLRRTALSHGRPRKRVKGKNHSHLRIDNDRLAKKFVGCLSAVARRPAPRAGDFSARASNYLSPAHGAGTPARCHYDRRYDSKPNSNTLLERIRLNPEIVLWAGGTSKYVQMRHVLTERIEFGGDIS
ncbi:hypothetical protein EVAR_63966_1 [Eumeta japonica]|uniref:Uncharacterized protein n=1 Tax=Eumeta variegata TaxID=151549 RepID=A0A4C1ZEH7_EUMVA|nr:hypothetical protein EVAR_63966_1 [Eumeta japonica]